jgi:TIR domain
MSAIFISYRREDSEGVAGRLFDHLVKQFGPERVFFDVESIPAGVDFRTHLGQTLRGCSVVLVLIGTKWLGCAYPAGPYQGQRRLDDPRDFVRIEVEEALRRQEIPVIPVLLGKATMPSEGELPQSLGPLAYRNAEEIRSGAMFADDVQRLCRKLMQIVPVAPRAVAVPVPVPATQSTGTEQRREDRHRDFLQQNRRERLQREKSEQFWQGLRWGVLGLVAVVVLLVILAIVGK